MIPAYREPHDSAYPTGNHRRTHDHKIRLASRDPQTEARTHAHRFGKEIKADSDVTQTDRAVALGRRFGKANIRALNGRLRICREAQRRRSPGRGTARSAAPEDRVQRLVRLLLVLHFVGAAGSGNFHGARFIFRRFSMRRRSCDRLLLRRRASRNCPPTKTVLGMAGSSSASRMDSRSLFRRSTNSEAHRKGRKATSAIVAACSMVNFVAIDDAPWSNLTLQFRGRRRAQHDGYRAAPLLGAPLELRVRTHNHPRMS